jgi:hypothetical protein
MAKIQNLDSSKHEVVSSNLAGGAWTTSAPSALGDPKYLKLSKDGGQTATVQGVTSSILMAPTGMQIRMKKLVWIGEHSTWVVIV